MNGLEMGHCDVWPFIRMCGNISRLWNIVVSKCVDLRIYKKNVGINLNLNEEK